MLDKLDDEMISKVFWSIHHFTKSAKYEYYTRIEEVIDKKTGELTKDAEMSIQGSTDNKIKLERLRKEIANILILKNICMGYYSDFIKRVAEENLD